MAEFDEMLESLMQGDNLEKLKEMAGPLLANLASNGGASASAEAAAEAVEDAVKNEESPDDFGIDFASLMPVINTFMKMNHVGDDHKVRLLKALRPFLSDKRSERLDEVVKIFKLTKLIDTVKESNLLGNIL